MNDYERIALWFVVVCCSVGIAYPVARDIWWRIVDWIRSDP